MLDQLDQAFGIQRQFLDDASHELRTPITIIRGTSSSSRTTIPTSAPRSSGSARTSWTG
jgi:signal transduction histidine kinase